MKQLIIIFASFIYVVICRKNLLELNDTCIAAGTTTNGICKFVEDCPSILKEIREEALFPTLCGFDVAKAIICCPEYASISNGKRADRSSTTSIKSNRISTRKCRQYHRMLVDRQSFECPSSIDHSSHIFNAGGEDADPREFPHMALLGYDVANSIKWICGGSLISENFILTAAHCVNTAFGEVKYVLFGELIKNQTNDEYPHQFNVIERIVHPDYKRPKKYNDIALLKIDGPVEFSDYIRPICLHDTTFNTELNSNKYGGYTIGWGHTDYDEPLSKHMQKVELDVFSHKVCNARYERFNSGQLDKGIDNATQFCAGSDSIPRDTCQGDSGGPFLRQHPNLNCMHTMIGLTSFGVSCGAGIPIVYTRVFPYLDWIEGVVWSDN